MKRPGEINTQRQAQPSLQRVIARQQQQGAKTRQLPKPGARIRAT